MVQRALDAKGCMSYNCDMAPNEKLKKWIADAGLNGAEAARRCNYDRHNFHRIITGAAKPTMELAREIENMTGGQLPLSAWIGFKAAKSSTPKAA